MHQVDHMIMMIGLSIVQFIKSIIQRINGLVLLNTLTYGIVPHLKRLTT